MQFFEELKRRNVFRVGIAYLIVAWLLAQIMQLVLESFGAPPWVMKTLLAVLAAGLPVALLFAWVFEMTPEGIRRERNVTEGASITAQTGRKLDRVIIVVLLIAVAWFAWDRHRLGQPGQPEVAAQAVEQTGASRKPAQTSEHIPVVAVLPFKASGSDDGGFLASGLHDDLLTRLAKLGAFRVISRTSMMEYADTTKNMRQIGEELGADFILEGGVQARGSRVRINAQLIDAPADEHIWAEIYQRDLTASDLFDVQGELAEAIARAMQTELSPSDRALVGQVPTRNLEAYNAYLKGLQTYETTGYIATQKDREARAAFEEAVRLDPGFALAWAGLATARIRADCCAWDAEQGEAVLEAVAQARALQPGLLEAELAWAEYQYRFKSEYGQALETLEALGDRLAGNVYALQLRAWLNRRLGRYDTAYQALQAARQLAPRSPSIYLDLTNYAWLLDGCDAAGRHVEQLLALAAEEPASRVRAAEYELECNGNARRAADLVRGLDFTKIGGWESAMQAAWLARDGQMWQSLNLAGSANPEPDSPAWQQLNLAVFHRYLEPDEALSNRAFAKAAELLEVLANDADFVQTGDFAALNASYYSFRGDAAETRRWIEEHRQRFHRLYRGDLAEEAKNHLFYAWAFAAAGLNDEAVEELRIMLEQPGGHRFPYFDGDPIFAALKDQPGYVALRERFGHGP